MSKTKGTQKTGGRGKGTPNRVTADFRQWVSKLIDDNRDLLEDDFKSLEPRERLMLTDKLMQYVIPKKREEEPADQSKTQSELVKRLFGKDLDND